ncbi:AhpC/TSA antioxidant enzyme-domain-containing protein [Apodospora peruviana]|uniref:AhpC/TSA antioxidant enzyme-domain-containing protein n=1 Tax=Apodospora peruviana TaxID=516989 RepID=A0AAE0IJY7_9PEZI|nr:AhpC/TSA antioxidant enzyme-domain-containing protein [Apodospora peruviana]
MAAASSDPPPPAATAAALTSSSPEETTNGTVRPTPPAPTPSPATIFPSGSDPQTTAATAATSDTSSQKEKKLALSTTTTTTTAADGAGAVTATATSSINNNPEQDDLQGSVDSNNQIPSAETLKKIENYMVLDRDGKSHSFKSLYTGKHAARRVLLIFVRHFFCGQCQEYLTQLSTSITPDALLRLPVSTFIAVIGCGDPGLIDMYATATNCPFPIYADPTRKLYDELGMIRTLAMGPRPAYTTKNILKSSIESVFQGLKQIKSGLATKAGDARQIGGEFLFEPLSLQSPVATPWYEVERRLGSYSNTSATSLDGRGEDDLGEEKRVTWCHRMKTTRDHAEIPELMEVLGLDGQGMPIKDKKRWSRALETRKGTGLSMASQISAMKMEAGEV